ncbi:MAG: enolase C-terminal domain-like protein, partial [Planctomycetota bacterium]|nr:enolase C-terminal domain-like protein [Planctomycetota bacterium]
YDVLEQNSTIESVAPPDFKMHYDFNWNRTVAQVLPIIKELAKSRIPGFIEDPLPWRDIAGWRLLREKCDIPFIMHVPQLGGGQEMLHGAADVYMLGGCIGQTLTSGSAFAASNIPVLLQITGGTLTKALAVHLAAVLPTATMHSVNIDDQYEEDITTERFPVVEGASPVPETPGLGFEVDEEALADLSSREPSKAPNHVAILHLKSGAKIYYPSLASVDVQKMTGREEGSIRGLKLELWDDDGSDEFKEISERVQKDGPFVSTP